MENPNDHVKRPTEVDGPSNETVADGDSHVEQEAALRMTLSSMLVALTTDDDVGEKVKAADAAFATLFALDANAAKSIVDEVLVEQLKANRSLIRKIDFWSTIRTDESHMYEQLLRTVVGIDAESLYQQAGLGTREVHLFVDDAKIKLGGVLRRTKNEPPDADLEEANDILFEVTGHIDQWADAEDWDARALKGTAKYERSFIFYRKGDLDTCLDLLDEAIYDAEKASDLHGELMGRNRQTVVQRETESIEDHEAKFIFLQIASEAGRNITPYGEVDLDLVRTQLNAYGRAVEVSTLQLRVLFGEEEEDKEELLLGFRELQGLLHLMKSNLLYEETKEEAGVKKQVTDALDILAKVHGKYGFN